MMSQMRLPLSCCPRAGQSPLFLVGRKICCRSSGPTLRAMNSSNVSTILSSNRCRNGRIIAGGTTFMRCRTRQVPAHRRKSWWHICGSSLFATWSQKSSAFVNAAVRDSVMKRSQPIGVPRNSKPSFRTGTVRRCSSALGSPLVNKRHFEMFRLSPAAARAGLRSPKRRSRMGSSPACTPSSR